MRNVKILSQINRAESRKAIPFWKHDVRLGDWKTLIEPPLHGDGRPQHNTTTAFPAQRNTAK